MFDKLMEEKYIYFGVVKLPLRLVQTEDFITKDANKLIETYGRNVSDMPPLIIRFVKDKFYAEVQKEMFWV